jgi:hypothetical protein
MDGSALELGRGANEVDHSQEHQGRSRSCPWLIRRFIDPEAEFLCVNEGELLQVAQAEQVIPFTRASIPRQAAFTSPT